MISAEIPVVQSQPACSAYSMSESTHSCHLICAVQHCKMRGKTMHKNIAA